MADGYVDLKRAKSKDDAKKNSPGGPTAPQEPEYPYGTRIHLEGDHVQKVYGDGAPAVGDEHEIHARGKIRSVAEDEDGGKRVEIQVTHMKRAPGKERSVRDDVKDAAAKVEMKRGQK